MDFIDTNVKKRGLEVLALANPHGMRGYIFIEAVSREDAELAFQGVPYARGLLPKPLDFKELEPMIEQIKTPMNIQERDIVEIISGPFKREKAKVKRIDEGKEEVVVELLEAAIPIPMTLKLDAVKVIRRETGDESSKIEEEEK